jgi:TonB family protein
LDALNESGVGAFSWAYGEILREGISLDSDYFRHFPLPKLADKVKEDGLSPMRRPGKCIIIALALCPLLLTPAGLAQKKERAERKVLNKTAPVIPDLAKRMHITGVVRVEAVVRANGSVKSTKVLGGNPVLIESAVEATRKWTFVAASAESIEVLQVTFDSH